MNILELLDITTINTVERMADEKNFIQNCDNLVLVVHNYIKTNWNYLLETNSIKRKEDKKNLVVNELQKFIEKIYADNIKKLNKDRGNLKSPSTDENRPYMVNVIGEFIKNERIIILYGTRYHQSITDTNWATVRGSL